MVPPTPQKKGFLDNNNIGAKIAIFLIISILVILFIVEIISIITMIFVPYDYATPYKKQLLPFDFEISWKHPARSFGESVFIIAVILIFLIPLVHSAWMKMTRASRKKQ